MNADFSKFRNVISNKFKYNLFLLGNLPMAFLAGLRVKKLDTNSATVIVNYKWINKNPFKSIYFAVLSMAAELTTGVLAFGNIYNRNPSVSMLVANMQAEFFKKAVGKITFTCNDGKLVENAVEKTVETGEGVTVTCTSVGINENGETVATFKFTWTFKRKK